MSKYFLFLFCIFISVSVTAETVYKKTNPDGSVEFTDQSSTDSEEVKIRKPIVIPAPRLPASSSPIEKEKVIDYVVTIIKPANDTTITGGSEIKVMVSVSPELFSGHQFRYQLGSQSLETHSNSVHFKDVVRGTHSIRVSVIDLKGELVSIGASSTVHMKRFFKKPSPPPPPPKKPKVP